MIVLTRSPAGCQSLFKKNVANEKLRESVGEALAAVVNTYRRMEGHDTHQVRLEYSLECRLKLKLMLNSIL